MTGVRRVLFRSPADESFAQVTVRPLANLTDPRLVLVLQPDTSAIPAQDEPSNFSASNDTNAGRPRVGFEDNLTNEVWLPFP